jgi:hypothetical protein
VEHVGDVEAVAIRRVDDAQQGQRVEQLRSVVAAPDDRGESDAQRAPRGAERVRRRAARSGRARSRSWQHDESRTRRLTAAVRRGRRPKVDSRFLSVDVRAADWSRACRAHFSPAFMGRQPRGSGTTGPRKCEVGDHLRSGQHAPATDCPHRSNGRTTARLAPV